MNLREQHIRDPFKEDQEMSAEILKDIESLESGTDSNEQIRQRCLDILDRISMESNAGIRPIYFDALRSWVEKYDVENSEEDKIKKSRILEVIKNKGLGLD